MADIAGRLGRILRWARTRKIVSWRTIPVVITVRDRVSTLKVLVDWLEREGMRHIVLVDNASTYPPLLDYLDQTPHEVIRLDRNVGPYAAWLPEIVRRWRGRAFIVTDPDVIPADSAHGAIREFARLLNRHPGYAKVGFGLRIDDLPDTYDLKDAVIALEAANWQREIAPGVFHATIDTTFALYRGGTEFVFGPALRTGGRYIARHEPWYTDSSSPSSELTYYRRHAVKDFATWGLGGNDPCGAPPEGPRHAFQHPDVGDCPPEGPC